MDYLHPVMAEALRGHWPVATEAELQAADVARAENKEVRKQEGYHRALQDQQQYLQNTGVLS